MKYEPDATVDESYNVSSITDNGEGEQTVNFSSSCANADYGVAAICTYPSGTNEHFCSLGGRNGGWNSQSAQNSGSCKIWTIYTEGSGNAQDVKKIAKKDVPTGKKYKIVETSDIPTDRSFRDAWSVDEANLTDGVGA